MIKRQILLARFNVAIGTWNEYMRRFSDSTITRKGMCISFEGSEEDFDELHDKLTENESNAKVIGIYLA